MLGKGASKTSSSFQKNKLLAGVIIAIKRRKGVSSVLSSIIMTAVVISIGSAIWYYSGGASSVMLNDYFNGTVVLLEELTERYKVIHVYYISDDDTLHAFVLNYGPVNITVDAYANVNSATYPSDTENPVSIPKGEYDWITVSLAVDSGQGIAIKIHSRRQNNAYYTYVVP